MAQTKARSTERPQNKDHKTNIIATNFVREQLISILQLFGEASNPGYLESKKINQFLRTEILNFSVTIL